MFMIALCVVLDVSFVLRLQYLFYDWFLMMYMYSCLICVIVDFILFVMLGLCVLWLTSYVICVCLMCSVVDLWCVVMNALCFRVDFVVLCLWLYLVFYGWLLKCIIIVLCVWWLIYDVALWCLSGVVWLM